jgi:hypothetical protein
MHRRWSVEATVLFSEGGLERTPVLQGSERRDSMLEVSAPAE